jgi:hypothetical protein
VKISVKVPNIRKTVGNAKTLLVKLPLKQKLIFSGIAVVILGGILTTSVIALNGSSKPQAVKTTPVAHVKKVPAKKVADASTTAPVAVPQPTAQPAATPAPVTPPANCPTRVSIRPGPTEVIPDSRGCPVTYTDNVANLHPTTPPNIKASPALINSNTYVNNPGYITLSSDGGPLNWSVTGNTGNFVLTGLPGDATTFASARIEATPGGQPGTYTITITGTSPVTHLSGSATVTLVIIDGYYAQPANP